MHITTIDIASANGKTTRGEDGDSHQWSSDEDWQHFLEVVAQHNLLVMDSNTYDTVKPEPQAERLRVVVAARPEDYAQQTVPGQLEFVSASPVELINTLEGRGYSKMLLVGGQINARFFAEGLVNEMYLTVEPVIFGSGANLLEGEGLSGSLKLRSVKQLNPRGTLVLHYAVDSSGRDVLS